MKIIFFISLITLCQASENVHNEMYVQLNKTMPCVLRLNGSHSFGCTSSRSGNVGVIHLAYNDSSLEWVMDSNKDNEYIVVLDINMFTLPNLKKLNDSANVNGVLLVQKEKRSKIMQFSPESQCPNRYSGLADAAHNYSSNVCQKNPWNKAGDEIAMQKWSMPMFFINDESTINEVEECFEKYNLPLSNKADRALCALELLSHMFASVDSTTCIRRSNTVYNFNPMHFCDPLANENIYAPVIPFDKFNKSKESYILVAARLDSTSLFYSHAPGALSTATSVVALLLTANLLTRLMINNTPTAKKNVLFLLFNGEAYDYIGSQKVVYDMERNEFPYKETPLSLADVGLFVELSQLKNDETLTYHTYDNLTYDNIPLIKEFIRTFKNIEQSFKFISGIDELTSKNGRFPPSSYQSFLARKAIPGFVLGSYREEFQNRFYHSLYDDGENVNYKFANGSEIRSTSLTAFVANFSNVLAYTLYEQMTGISVPRKLNITYEMADDVLCCFLESVGCEFFSRFEGSGLSELNLDYYVSVANSPSHMTTLSRDSLAYLMGRNVSAANQNECYAKSKSMPAYTYLWVPTESQCLESYVNSTFAISPAFTIPEYKLDEGIYSSWTESVWLTLGVRMFRKPSAKYEWLVCTIGSAILISSFLILFWIRRNSKELFNFPQLIATSSI